MTLTKTLPLPDKSYEVEITYWDKDGNASEGLDIYLDDFLIESTIKAKVESCPGDIDTPPAVSSIDLVAVIIDCLEIYDAGADDWRDCTPSERQEVEQWIKGRVSVY